MLTTVLAMDLGTVTLFIGTGILLNLTPGADVAFATASGISGGWRAGVAAAIGISLGSLLHTLLAALGVAAALAATPHAFDAIRWLGAGYLAYLAWTSWTAKAQVNTGTGARSIAAAIGRGFVTNALNPKVALFIMALLPQFTVPSIGPVWQQILVLGVLFTASGMIVTSAYGTAAGFLGDALRMRQKMMNRLTALIYGGLAARLVFD